MTNMALPSRSVRPVLQQARYGGAMDQGRQAGDALDAVVVPSVPGERSAPAAERPGLQPGQLVAQTGPAAADQALVAHQSPAAAGEDGRPTREACAVLLAPPGGRAPDPAAVRRHAAEDLGATGAGRLTRGLSATKPAWRRNGTSCGAVSEKCLESRGSSRFHVTAGCGDSLWSRPIGRRTKFRALGGSRVYKGTIRGKQIGNPGQGHREVGRHQCHPTM